MHIHIRQVISLLEFGYCYQLMKWNSLWKMSILARNVFFWVLSPIAEVEKFLSDYSCVKGILINVIYIQGLKKKWDKKCWCNWISIRLRKQYDSPASIFKETIGKWKCRRTAMIKYFFRTFIYKGEDLHKRKNIKFILITSLWYTPTEFYSCIFCSIQE